MKQKVVIVGCGWLGQQLAQSLLPHGFRVFGTRQSVAGLADLPWGVEPLLLQLPQTSPEPGVIDIFKESWLICAVPPSTRQQSADHYAQQLQSLVAIATQAGSRGLIHCSSSGVYQGLAGDVDEFSQVTDNPRAQLLLSAEQILQQLPNCVTLRLAGLIGPGRSPARFGQGRTLSGPDLPVNLIHASDICGFVQKLLSYPGIPEQRIFNLCCPEHPHKADFYHAAAAVAGLPGVDFVAAEEPARRVLSFRSTEFADFRYQYPSPMQALTDS